MLEGTVALDMEGAAGEAVNWQLFGVAELSRSLRRDLLLDGLRVEGVRRRVRERIWSAVRLSD